MTHRLRVGAVSYLNTKPLVFGLERIAPDIELIFDLPSRLADRLAAGDCDVALIPSVEYFQHPDYEIVSDACIACRGPVWSVKLFSRVPLPQIRSLALDEGSRTSAALVRILLKERFQVEPQLQQLPIGATAAATNSDAVLLIGDRAMHDPGIAYLQAWDLGEEWCRWSKLPFVFAMWVARRGERGAELSALLGQARDSGVEHLPAIAETEAPRYGLTVPACLRYLRDHLHFFLGLEERRGLELFREHAVRFGMAPAAASPSRGFDQAATSRSPATLG